MSSTLNEENATGLNRQLADRNIEEFDSACWMAHHYLKEAYKFLFDELFYIWASPKAVEFDSKWRPQIEDMLTNFKKEYAIVTQNAIRQYNMVARANGAEEIVDYKGDSMDNTYYLPDRNYVTPDIGASLLDNQNGITGMNIEQVKNLLSLFATRIASVETHYIDTIPSYIALFDTANAQQQDFAINVKNVKAKVEELNIEIFNAINNAIETEINTLALSTFINYKKQ